MRTFILAWVIGLLGLIMIAGGIWGIIDLFRQEVRARLKSYGGAVSMVCGGFAILGVAQAMRLPCSYCDRPPFGLARARRTARARASLQVSLRLATADLRQAPNFPPPRSTLAHCCRRWALHSSLSDLRTSANLASVTRHGNETSRMCSLMQARSLLFPG